MPKLANQTWQDYPGLEPLVLQVVNTREQQLKENSSTPKRLTKLEKAKDENELRWNRLEDRLGNIEKNLILYREDAKIFRSEIRSDNLIFKDEIKEGQKKFEEMIKEEFKKIDQRFERIDQRFERIDQRFEKMDQRFEKMDEKFDTINAQIIDLHKSFTRTTILFMSGIALIGTILTIVDKLWLPYQ